MQKKRISRVGFALPTVLIASVVMLTVLTVSVSSVVAVRTALLTQYYEQLAKTAGEAGVAYAKACLAKNGNVPLWTDNKPLRPSTDCAGNALLEPEISVLVVGGGGGGGDNHGGGGGGGGVLTQSSYVVSAQSYPIVVGAGGAGGAGATGTRGANGANSSFASITALGGGGGGGRTDNGSVYGVTQPGVGGAGGGAAGTIDAATSLPGAGALGTPGQGFAGGNGSAMTTSVKAGNGGGGGGAGAIGQNAVGTASGAGTSGAGGIGYASTISGALVFYGGGGSGGRWFTGAVGQGGLSGGGLGGAADSAAGAAGLPNSGGGGGGGGGATADGGPGGSGVVVVSYPRDGSVTASPQNPSNVDTYDSGVYRVHIFKANNSLVVTNTGTATCPTNPRCSVMVGENVRSSFAVLRPTLDENGRAAAIPNSGYVDLLRESNGEVWRTYYQPTVQAAIVPDLCSGAATSSLGWSPAVETSVQTVIPAATTARSISLADTELAAGFTYFRKDFNVVSDGMFEVYATSPTGDDKVEIFIDGVARVTAQGTLQNGGAIPISAGCHTITARMTNFTLVSRPISFTAAVKQVGSSNPVVATGSDWRVSAGMAVHFSDPEYNASGSIWRPVQDYTIPTAQLANTNWQNVVPDVFTRLISPADNGCVATCPGSSSAYLRDSKDFYLTGNTEILVSTLCDDYCTVYIDGEQVLISAPWSSISQQTLTLTAGAHRVGVRLYNGAAFANPSGVAISVVDKNAGVVLTRTDRTWTAANVWTPGANTETASVFSYEKSFLPSPNEIAAQNTIDLLIVGGGGGGGTNSAGGGGGGGVVWYPDTQFSPNTYNIVVGAGGAGSVNSSARGSNGGNSSFGATVALGGGGGASRDEGLGGATGGSGGGGSGAVGSGTNYNVRHLGGTGSPGRGYDGGNGTIFDQGVAAKGGGGGGAGGGGVAATTIVAGNGGAGFISYITGSKLAFAGGGGGGTTAINGYLGGGTDGGTSGNVYQAATPAANTGGGAGGGGTSAAGGSGVVIVRVKTGKVNVTTTGSPIVTPNVVLNGVNYTIYRYNANGSFTITSYN